MKSFIILAVLVLTLSLVVFAQVPNKISYQGLLTTSSGTPVPDGSYDLQFDIYNLPSGGDLRHTETQNGVAVQKGVFSIILKPSSTIFSESLYVEVTALAGPSISSPLTFLPRSELTSAPYALAPWKSIGKNIYYLDGYIGIGTSTPGYQFHQLGDDHVIEDADISLRRDGKHRWRIQETASSGIRIRQVYNDAHVLQNITHFEITDAGNVGIGTTSPTSKLEVNGSLTLSSGKIMIGGASSLGNNYAIEAKGGSFCYSKYYHNSSGLTSGDGLLVGLQESNNRAWLWNYENGAIEIGANNDYALTVEADNDVKLHQELHTDYGSEARMIPVAFGRIISDGSISTSFQGGDFSCTRTAVGTYSITINNPTGTMYMVPVVTCFASAGSVGTITSYNSTTRTFTVKTANSAGTETDLTFFFQVFAP